MASQAAGVVSLAAYIERFFTQDTTPMAVAMMREHPLLKMLQIREDLGNDNRHPLNLSAAGGLSTSIAGSMNHRHPSGHDSMSITPKQFFMPATWNRRDLILMRDGKAVQNAADTELKAAKQRLKTGLSGLIWGDAGGSIGQLSARSLSSGDTLCTFVRAGSTHKMEAGDYLQFSNVDGTSGGSVRAGGSSNTDAVMRVKSVDRQAGTFLLDGDYTSVTTGIPSLGASDYVFPNEFFGNGLSGFFGWLPDTVTATAFNGMDRTAIDTQRAAGSRVDGVDENILDALENLVYEVRQYSPGENLMLWTSLTNYKDVARQLDSRKTVELTDSEGKVGLSGIQFAPNVALNWDTHCDDQHALCTNLNDWALRSSGKMMGHILNDAGGVLHYLGMLSSSHEDAYAAMLTMDCDLVCDAPERQGVAFNLGTVS